MNKTEHARRARLAATLTALGFTDTEAAQLRRVSMTLRRWHGLECGTEAGFVERDEETGKTYFVADTGTRRRWPTPDRETGARRRLSEIMARRNERDSTAMMSAYIQTDPRGCALHILRPGDVPPGKDPGAYYTNGIAVY